MHFRGKYGYQSLLSVEMWCIVAYNSFQFLVHEFQFKMYLFFHNYALLFIDFRNKMNHDVEFKAFLAIEILYTIK